MREDKLKPSTMIIILVIVMAIVIGANLTKTIGDSGDTVDATIVETTIAQSTEDTVIEATTNKVTVTKNNIENLVDDYVNDTIDKDLNAILQIGQKLEEMPENEREAFLTDFAQKLIDGVYAEKVALVNYNNSIDSVPDCKKSEFVKSDMIFCFPSTKEIKENNFNEIKTYSEMEKFFETNSDLYYHNKDAGKIEMQKISYSNSSKEFANKTTSDAIYRVFTISDKSLSPYNQLCVGNIKYNDTTGIVYIILEETQNTYSQLAIAKEDNEKFEKSKSAHCIVELEIYFDAVDNINEIQIVLPKK